MELKFGRYQHYTGRFYRVLGIAKHSNPPQELVICMSVNHASNNKLLIHPMKVFTENVIVAGKAVPQFVYVDEE